MTVLLPRRTFGRLSGRLLHDRTADRIAEAMSRLPHVSATIVPFDTTLPPQVAERLAERRQQAAERPSLSEVRLVTSERPENLPHTEQSPGITPIGQASFKDVVTVAGRVVSLQVGTLAGRSLEVEVFDASGGIRMLFFGRTAIRGIECGTLLRATGRVGEFKGHLALANPRYELVPENGGRAGSAAVGSGRNMRSETG